MPNNHPPDLSGEEEEDAASQGINSAIDDILDQYRFHWEPEYRLKFKKELAGYTLAVGLSKPHMAPTRLRLTVKPAICDEGWRPGRFVQKVLVMPQQHFAALYSRKLAWGFLRCQFVAGYFWDRKRPSLDYRLSTKWNDGLRFKRKEYYQPTDNLLLRAKWNLDMQLPDVEGHIGGGEGSTQVPMDVEYGSMDFSVVQLDWVCDLDGFKDRKKHPARTPPAAAAPPPLEVPSASAAAAPASVASALAPSKTAGRLTWPPFEHLGRAALEHLGFSQEGRR